MAAGVKLCLSSLVILAALQGVHTLEFRVSNRVPRSPGGTRFRNEVGALYCARTMISATRFIWRLFEENSPSDRKEVEHITLFVEYIDVVAYVVNDEIHVSAEYIEDYSGDVRIEITGLVYHLMTRIWQWDGNGEAPVWLIEGAADYVRLKAGYAPSHWVKPGQGDRWDQGHDVTARFLEYCDSLRGGFVAELNKRLRKRYSNVYFTELLGKPVEQVWSDYKAKFNN